MSTLVEARGVNAGYDSTVIVRGLDLEVNPGEVVALLGANGAGKTTTLLTLAGELAPMAGTVLFHGEPTRAPLDARARRGLGFISEERSILMRLTVAENLRVSRGNTELALSLFPELVDHLDRKAATLSGGQQQILALARALAREPSVILADELSLGLAPLIVDRLLRTVREAADGGAGVLLVEQHVHKALEIADRVYVMQRGRIELTGTADELRARVDDVRDAYLGAGSAAPFEKI